MVIQSICALVAVPVERVFQPVLIDPVPAFRGSPLRICVSAAFDEPKIFAVADQARTQIERLQQSFVARQFVVEGETCTSMADRGDAAHEPDPLERCSRRGMHLR